jgi:hypothetical protein
MYDQPTSPAESPKPRRRWFQFSLRTLLVVTVLFSFTAAWYGNNYLRIKRQREATSVCLSHGCYLSYSEPSKGEDIREYAPFASAAIPAKPVHTTNSRIWEFMFGDDNGDQLKLITIDVDQDSKKVAIDSFKQFPNLKFIRLNGKLADGKLLRQIVNNVPRLEMLALYEGDFNAEDIQALRNLKNLRHLDLVSRSFDDDKIKHLSELENLTHLTFNITKITSKGMEQVALLEHLEFLEFAMAGKIDDTAISKLTGLKQLRKLWLQNASITDLGLADLGQLPELEELRLHGCGNIEGSGFAKFDNSKKLKNLFMWSARFNDAGLKKLVKSEIPLEDLWIVFGKITDDGFRNLESLKSLKSLTISNGYQIANATAEYLRQKLPQCKISAAVTKP